MPENEAKIYPIMWQVEAKIPGHGTILFYVMAGWEEDLKQLIGILLNHATWIHAERKTFCKDEGG